MHLKEVGRMPAYCMVNFCGKCQRQLTKIRPGKGLGKVTKKLKLVHLSLQLKNRH